MQLGSMFISNCNNTLHVSDAFCVHPQEHLKTVVYDMRRGEVSNKGVQGRWLLLQFLSAPEDGRKKRPKHVEYYCS